MAIVRTLLLGLGVAGSAQASGETRNALDESSIFQIILGQYKGGLRPLKKALVIVDSTNVHEQFCDGVFDAGVGYCPRVWLTFINLLNIIDALNFNTIVYTMDAYPDNHILIHKPDKKIFDYHSKTGALCKGEDIPDDVYSVECTNEEKIIVDITGKTPPTIPRDATGAYQPTGLNLLQHLLMAPNAAILKKNSKAHVINGNLFQDRFTEKMLEDEPYNTAKWWEITPQETSLDHFFGTNGAEIADMFFVGGNLGVIQEAAMAARKTYGYKTFVLMDGVARDFKDQLQTAEIRANLEKSDINVRQYVSDADTFGKEVLGESGYEVDASSIGKAIELGLAAFSALSYEIATTPEEFVKTGVALGSILWILVGGMIGGVIIGSIVTCSYMRTLNPKTIAESKEAGIIRTRSGEA